MFLQTHQVKIAAHLSIARKDMIYKWGIEGGFTF